MSVLKGNPVRIWSCPRNCMCGRTSKPLYRLLLWWRYGKGYSRMKHKPGDLPKLEVSFLRGVRRWNDGKTSIFFYCLSVVICRSSREWTVFLRFHKKEEKKSSLTINHADLNVILLVIDELSSGLSIQTD